MVGTGALGHPHGTVRVSSTMHRMFGGQAGQFSARAVAVTVGQAVGAGVVGGWWGGLARVRGRRRRLWVGQRRGGDGMVYCGDCKVVTYEMASMNGFMVGWMAAGRSGSTFVFALQGEKARKKNLEKDYGKTKIGDSHRRGETGWTNNWNANLTLTSASFAGHIYT